MRQDARGMKKFSRMNNEWYQKSGERKGAQETAK